MFPDVAMRAQGLSAQGGQVGNEEREKLRPREIKNASCGKDGDLEAWESRRQS